MKQHPDGDETLPVSEKREIDTERVFVDKSNGQASCPLDT